MSVDLSTGLFDCPCCDREQPARRLSRFDLVDDYGNSVPICVQCSDFLAIGLEFLVDRVANGKKSLVVRRSDEDVLKDRQASETIQVSPKKPSVPPRPASNKERELFGHQAIGVERYIQGFVKGLEVGGMGSKQLDTQTVSAVNYLIDICHQLAVERGTVTSDAPSRAEVRRLTRHLKDTSMLVDEYVEIVEESFNLH